MSGPSPCEAVRGRLLEGADLADIRETARAHIEGCPACRGALARVEDARAALAIEIDAIQPRFSAREAVALATRADTPASQRRTAARWLGTDGRRRLAWAAGPAVALAAAILGIVWAGPWRPADIAAPSEGLSRGIVTTEGAGTFSGLSVEAPETGGVAVFATRNPDIHVVWFYETRSSTEGER